MNTSKRLLLTLISIVLSQVSLAQSTAFVKIDLDGRGGTDLKPQATPIHVNLSHPEWIDDPALRKQYVIAYGTEKLAANQWTPLEFTLIPAQSAKIRMSLRSSCTNKRQHVWTAYRKLTVTGATCQTMPLKLPGRMKHVEGGPHIYYGAHDVSLPLSLDVTANQPFTVTAEAMAGPVLPRNQRPEKVDPMDLPPPRMASADMPPEYYNFYGDRVKYLPLKDKGLFGEQIARNPRLPDFKPYRPLPQPQFLSQTADRPNLPTTVNATVEFLEEAGVARPNTPVRFGFPLPQGRFFRTGNLKVINPQGQEVPAQVAFTAQWPDQSAKWALIQFSAPLKAHEKTLYRIVNGKPQAFTSHLTWKKAPAGYEVSTGKLTALVNENLITNIVVKGQPKGGFQTPKLVCEDGTVAPCTLNSVTVEEQGPRVLQVLLQGKLGQVADFQARLRFYNQSAVVYGEFTFLNANLKREFTDYTSLSLIYQPHAAIKTMTVDGDSTPDRFLQTDEGTLNGKRGTMSGTAAIRCQDGSSFNLALKDPSLRYPKALAHSQNTVTLELLPQQPSRHYGEDMPYYLRFPFVEGKYRMKWGTSFTETFQLDFSGATPELTTAEISRPVIPWVSRNWLSKTKAFPGISPDGDQTFKDYDQQMTKTVKRHLMAKQSQREFGFMNLGDWFGERGRNWGNNEYDTAFGLFTHFLRTGNREAARLASWAANHQADVDIVHAYPDPYFVGANAQHGIGHTGISYQQVKRASWSHRYDGSYEAGNGHTWARGMMTEWALNGNARVMAAGLMLGEHLCFAWAPTFYRLGTHERSAGWSLTALLGIYHMRPDPEYLKTARHIAEVPLREQKFNQGGAWPHVLPLDHASGVRGRVGNCPYLIGILLHGLTHYYEATGDPRAEKSIVSGATWLKNVWDNDSQSWHYGVTWDGKSCNGPSQGLNPLIVPAVMTAANLTGDKDMYNIAATVMNQLSFKGASSGGKDIGIGTVTIPGLLDGLTQWNRKHPQNAYHYSPAEVVRKGLQSTDKSFKLRAPDQKTFLIRILKDDPTVTITRTRHGARPKCLPTGNLKIIGGNNQQLAADTFKTKEAFIRNYTLKAKAGEQVKLLIDDDLTAVWDVAGKDIAARAVLVPNSTVDARGMRHFLFTVPAGSTGFKLHVRPIHSGTFMVAIADENKGLKQHLQDSYHGVCQLPWHDTRKNADPHRIMTLTYPPATHDRTWHILAQSGGDLALWFQDIPSEVRIQP